MWRKVFEIPGPGTWTTPEPPALRDRLGLVPQLQILDATHRKWLGSQVQKETIACSAARNGRRRPVPNH